MVGSRIVAGCRVSGRFGELIDYAPGEDTDANGKKKRRIRREVYGTVVASCGLQKWQVHFDHNGEVKNNVSSTQLKVVDDTAGIPISAITTVSVYIQCIS